MLQRAAIGIGLLLNVLGIAGFLPFITTGSANTQQLLGVFTVDTTHNLFLFASGLAAFATANNERYAQRYFQIFGVIFMFIAVIGLLQKTTVLGLFGVNMADNMLHVGVTVLLLGLGFAPRGEQEVSSNTDGDNPGSNRTTLK